MADIQTNTQNIETEVRNFNAKTEKLDNALESLNQTVDTQAQSPEKVQHESRQESPILSVQKGPSADTVHASENIDQSPIKVESAGLNNATSTVSTHHIAEIIQTAATNHVQKTELAKSTFLAENASQYPRYDKQRLDDIVGRILNVRYTANTSRVHENTSHVHSYEPKYSTIGTYSRNVPTNYLETRYAPLRVYENNIHHGSVYYNTQLPETYKVSSAELSKVFNPVPVQKTESPQKTQTTEKVAKAVKSATHHCGVAENDIDSLIFDHIKEVQEEVSTNNQQYNNFYVGSLNDDHLVDELPRTKRVNKRQEVAQARKQNRNNEEFVEKSVYDQKKNQKSNTEQAKKALNAGASVQEDFDFSRKKATKA